MKMYCISDNTDTRTGLRLAGIDGCIVRDAAELKERLDYVMSDRDIGILLIVEKLAKQFPDILAEIKLTRLLPLVIEIPDRHGTGRSPEFITDYVREAIGIKL